MRGWGFVAQWRIRRALANLLREQLQRLFEIKQLFLLGNQCRIQLRNGVVLKFQARLKFGDTLQ